MTTPCIHGATYDQAVAALAALCLRISEDRHVQIHPVYLTVLHMVLTTPVSIDIRISYRDKVAISERDAWEGHLLYVHDIDNGTEDNAYATFLCDVMRKATKDLPEGSWPPTHLKH